jgi:hypothetical protein
MRTSLKVILATTAIAALASPVMAQSESHRHAASRAYGSVAHGHAYGSVVRGPTTPVIQGNPYHIDDAEHVPFPQQDGGN